MDCDDGTPVALQPTCRSNCSSHYFSSKSIHCQILGCHLVLFSCVISVVWEERKQNGGYLDYRLETSRLNIKFFWQYDSKWLRALFRISTWFWFFTLFSSEMSIKWWHRRRLGRRWQSCTRTFFHGPPSVYWSSHELLNEKVSFDYATRRFAALFVSTQSQLLIESTLAQSCWLIT